MKKRNFGRIITALFMLSLASTANASLSSQDFSAPDDGHLTYDSSTGLSWLDLTETVGQTYSDVISGYGGFTTNLGFRLATGGELAQLRTDAGITGVRGTTGDIVNISNTLTLINLFGVLYTDGHSSYSFGYIADTADLSGQGKHALADFGVNDIGEYNAYIGGYDSPYPNNIFDILTDPSFQETNKGITGSFLVKEFAPVPLPNAIFLFGTVIAGFVGTRIKREKK